MAGEAMWSFVFTQPRKHYGSTPSLSTGVVALANIGDKTQLLAFLLAARFKKPVPIILGILVATLINHGLAGALGAWITTNVDPSPDGHLKLLHLWPVKLLQAGRMNYA